MLFLPLSSMNKDEQYIQRCIELAKLGEGLVAPNPMVGSVLVYDDKIIGEGYHQLYGQAHAEVNCINDAERRHNSFEHTGDTSFSEMLQNSTLYVSLEPCAHYGKTPPCADLIIANKIPRVVIGCRDPFDQVDGKGIGKLLAAGTTVQTGVLEDACIDLNKRFFTFHTKQRPYIILKWAQSADAKIASRDRSRVYITNDYTNRVVHKWRSEEASILVGTNTAIADDPSLTNRLWSGNNPVRLVVDMQLRLPGTLHLFDGTVKTIIFNAQKHEETNGLVYYKLEGHLPLAKQICAALYQLHIQSVLVEGGTKLLQTFIDEQLWDEARVITNNDLLIGQGLSAPILINAASVKSLNLVSDIIRNYKFTV